MSEYYDSTSYTPPISPEERQRRQINDAVNTAIRAANVQHKNIINDLQKRHNQEIDKLNNKIKSLDGKLQSKMKRRQEQLDKIRKEYENQLQKASSEAEKKRQQDKIEFKKDIDIITANVEDLRNKTRKALDATNKSIENLRNETILALNEQQKQITNIVDEVHGDKAKAKAIKQELSKEFNAHIDMIKAKNHEKFAPNELKEIVSKLDGIDSLPNDSACSILHNSLRDLYSLEEEIEKSQSEYDHVHKEVLNTANEVLEIMKQNRNTITDTDIDGKEIKIDFDHWTENEYFDLEKDLSQIIQDITIGYDDPKFNLNALEEKLERINEINNKQKELVNESIIRFKAAKRRKELADSIVDILGGERFHVIEQGHENNDMRNAYFIKLDDNRSKILVIINPINNTDSGVVIKAIDTELPESSLNERIKDIVEVLNPVGVRGNKCNNQDPVVDKAFREIYDINVVNQNIPAEIKERAKLRDIRTEQANLKMQKRYN